MGRWALVCLVILACGCAKPASGPQTAGGTGPAVEGEGAAAAKGAIAWSYDFEEGMAQAQESGKPVMVDVFATWCAPCKLLDENVFSRADVAEASTGFLPIKVDGDKYPEVKDKLGVTGYPSVVFLRADGTELGRSTGAVPYDVMLEAMAKAQETFAAAE